MTFEQDTIIDFIEWLGEKHQVILVDVHKILPRLVSEKKLEKLLEEWGDDVEEWDK